MRRLACVSVVLAAACPVECFSGAALSHLALGRRAAGAVTKRVAAVPLRMQVQNEDKPKSTEEVTKKYGLEAGVFTALTSKDKSGPNAKDLLKKYGSAYLVTSITLALISFSICYVLVDNGVDVGEVLSKFGIEAGDKAETAGTVAIAYAAHKAASPIRFPPTVALTPLTAKYLFNKEEQEDETPDESAE
eukprot:CAMPEP_0179406174 /NCGR_PEP_ID=MMETSP0799-20121207/733_1 /TAXON_ID=46947 /ORGANISM="Geminigera cryophila, Strain CCMP2564" /LENGTH=189 /DNA_ID=CAMNT_0021177179 /DNA_START=1720 /DNA_END=2289 /DNA_ORIENTATION=-